MIGAENNLRIIIDLHIALASFQCQRKTTDSAERARKFFDLWRDLSALNKRNNLVTTMMNEAVADNPEWWNNLIANAVEAIRQLQPIAPLLLAPIVGRAQIPSMC